MKKWRCQSCGYIHDGENAPEVCPKCGAPRERFIELEEVAGNLIERSRTTNALHMELHAIMKNVLALCDKGIEDNLDPGCVAIFQRARTSAIELMHSVKAELQSHMNKGKWG